MAKKKVKDIVSDLVSDFLAENDLELFNIEYVKEGKTRFLRIYIDKPWDGGEEERYVSIEECELVSRYLSDRLDEEDPVEEEYTLEVSSPGIDRPLIRESDYTRYAGRLVDVRLYRAADGRKQFSAVLRGLENGRVLMEDEESGAETDVMLEDISKITLAVVF